MSETESEGQVKVIPFCTQRLEAKAFPVLDSWGLKYGITVRAKVAPGYQLAGHPSLWPIGIPGCSVSTKTLEGEKESGSEGRDHYVLGSSF